MRVLVVEDETRLAATLKDMLEMDGYTVDVRHDAAVGSGYHYMIADAAGDCAVVEFDREDRSEERL